MSGVESRTRLQQLLSLQRRTQHDISSALRRDAQHELGRLQQLNTRLDAEITAAGGTPLRRDAKGKPKTRRKKAEDRVTKHLEQLGVTAHDVKVWAVATGLTDAVRRGRIKSDLVAAYEAAH